MTRKLLRCKIYFFMDCGYCLLLHRWRSASPLDLLMRSLMYVMGHFTKPY